MASQLEFSTVFGKNLESVGEEEKGDLSFSMIVDNGSQKAPQQTTFSTIQPRTRTRWVEDTSVSRCSCKAHFGMFTRKSHCRYCGGVFCSNCTKKKIIIPQYLNIPTPAKGKEFCDDDRVKVCRECFQKISQVKKIQTLIEVFNLIDLDIFDFKIMSQVCRTWNQLSNFYLSKIREIQYALPTHKYDEYEKNALWTNRKYFIGHNIWITHLMRSIDYQKTPEKKIEIVSLMNNHIEIINNNTQKNNNECWELMCTRRCQRDLSSECALMLLENSSDMNKLPEIRKFAVQYLFSENVTTDELCCYINYLVQCAATSKSSIILDSLLDEISKFEVGKGLYCETNKRCIRIASELFWELRIGSHSDSIFLAQKYEEMTEKFQNHIHPPFQKILNKSLNLVETIQENYDSTDQINMIKSLGSIDTTINPLYPDRGNMEMNASQIEIKHSITKPVIIPMKAQNENDENDEKSQNALIMYKKEDIRKDQIIMSIIRLMDLVLKKELDIDLGIITYRVRPTTPDEGFIDIVTDCCTLYKIKQESKTLLNYILEKNPNSTQKDLRDRFVKSCSAYCVITFLLGIGDRHLENIMVTDDGRLFHIDYGFILGQDPKPLKMSHIRISSDMLDALGGYNSQSYKQFKQLCNKIYNVLRRHLNLFACLLGLFASAHPRIDGSKFFTEHKILQEISKRFAPGENYREAEIHLHNRIDNSTTTASAFRYGVVDFFHKHNKEQTVKNVISATANTTFSVTKNIVAKVWDLIIRSGDVNVE